MVMYDEIRNKKKLQKQLKDLSKGFKATKHGRKGKPHPRFISFSQNYDTVTWRPVLTQASNKPVRVSSFPMLDFDEVKKGAETKVFKRTIKSEQHPKYHACFSFIGPKRTLDLEFGSDKERDEVFELVDAVFQHVKTTQKNNFLNNTASSSSESNTPVTPRANEDNRKSMTPQKRKGPDVDKCIKTLEKFSFDNESTTWKISKVLTKSAKFSDDDAMHLAITMENHPILKALDLTDLGLSDMGLSAIWSVIHTVPNLTHVTLTGNVIGVEASSAMARCMKQVKSLRYLDLTNTQITDHALNELSFALSQNKSLEELYLDKNGIGDEGACALADVLKDHENMRVVSMNDNQIGNMGAKALATTLKQKHFKLEVLKLARNHIVFPERKQQEHDPSGADSEAVDGEEECLEVNLFLAVDCNNYAEVVLLCLRGADINIQNEEDGKTPLHIAAIRGDMLMIDFVLDHPNLDLNVRDDRLTTPAYGAMEHKMYDVVKLLLEKGADPKIGDKHKKTLLHLAAEQGERAMVKLLIETYNDDLNNTTTSEITALHLAAQNQHKAVVEYLLQRDEHERKEFYKNAANKKQDEAEEEHVTYVNWQDVVGETALHKVFHNGKYDIEIAKMLVQRGADVSIEDNHGRTALTELPSDVQQMLLNEARNAMARRMATQR